MRTTSFGATLVALLLGLAAPTVAQSPATHHPAPSPHLILPPWRAVGPDAASPIVVAAVRARVAIVERVATTTLDVDLRNDGRRDLEAEIGLPVPPGSVIRSFDFQGEGAEPTARVLPEEEARRIYSSIVSRLRDPALLEFVGTGLIRSSVFPVPANGAQRVRIVYEEILPIDGDRVDYLLPRSEDLGYRVPWDIAVDVKSPRGIAAIYSPSHELVVGPGGGPHATATLSSRARTDPGTFRLSWLVAGSDVTASVFAYPDPGSDGGWFLLLAGLPDSKGAVPIAREVTLVLDCSGSMRGEKLAQVVEAATQIVHGLRDGERFNILSYSQSVDRYAASSVVKDAQTAKDAERHLRSLTAAGGTNLYDALHEALLPAPPADFLPLVLFLTDGLPTVGCRSEELIRNLATEANPYQRRVFTFGVGADVNTPLLDGIASSSRAAPTFALPGEDVEVKVGSLFARLEGPVLTAPILDVLDSAGRPDASRIKDVLPRRMQDVFRGDQIVVLGRYRGSEPIRFRLRGMGSGGERRFAITARLDRVTTRNAFVPRLWASRRIAELVEAIRQGGAQVARPGSVTAAKDGELVDEIVRLSTEFGILTEYTSFLAETGTDLTNRPELNARAAINLDARAVHVRSGLAGLNQDLNNNDQRAQTAMNPRNAYWDANLQRVELTAVQQRGDRTFFRQGDRWVDVQLLGEPVTPDRVVTVGSAEHVELARRLAAAGRQSCVSLGGEILLRVDGRTVLVTGGAAPAVQALGR